MEKRTIKTIHDYECLSFDDEHVFRGESKDCYSLLPSAYRNNSCLKNDGPKLEIMCVQGFIHHLWQRGYHTFPNDWNEINILTISSKVFPTEDMLPYMALAQHYASDSQFFWLKTSLLDVTYSLDIAAYFAVKSNYEHNGKIYVLNKTAIKPLYGIYEPHMDTRKEARMIVQHGALVYRKQEYESVGEMYRYKNCKPFDDIVAETIIIPDILKEELKEYLRKKLFDSVILPKMILGPMTPDMSSVGIKSFEEIRNLHIADIEIAENAGNRHSNY